MIRRESRQAGFGLTSLVEASHSEQVSARLWSEILQGTVYVRCRSAMTQMEKLQRISGGCPEGGDDGCEVQFTIPDALSL